MSKPKLRITVQTRSQAVARIADRTASQQLRGHATSSVTWLFDSPYAISYWWSFGTGSLNAAVFKILRSDHIGVTSVTFQGHVTSSVTWPFDSPYAISYWCSFGTKPLSLTVSEIFNAEFHTMVDMTLIWPLNEDQGHPFFVPIDFSYTTSHRLSILVTFTLGPWTHRLATIHTSQTTNRRTQHCTNSATVIPAC